MKNSFQTIIAIAICAAAANSSAFAASAVWNGGSGSWATGSNWTPAAAPGNPIQGPGAISSDSASFNTGTGTVTVDRSRNINTLVLGPSAGSYTFTGGSLLFSGNYAQSLQMNTTATGVTDTFNTPLVFLGIGSISNSSSSATDTLVINGSITDGTNSNITIGLNGGTGGAVNTINGSIGNGGGSLGLNVGQYPSGGPSKWILTGVNDFSGGLNLGNNGNIAGAFGYVQLANANASENSIVNENGNATVSNQLTFSTNIGTFNLGGLAGTVTSSQSLTDLGGNAVTLNLGLFNNQNTSGYPDYGYAGVISGSGGITKLGWGSEGLSGNNTYTGTTTISGLTLNTSSRVDTLASTLATSGTPFGTGNIVMNGGLLSISPGSGTTVSDTGASATATTKFTYNGGSVVFLQKGTGLTFTVGSATPTGDPLAQGSAAGTLILQTGTNGDLGAGAATGEDFVVTDAAQPTNSVNHMASASIVTLNGGTGSTSGSNSGDFVTYGANGFASDGSAYTTRSGTIVAGTTGANEITNLTGATSFTGNNSTYALLVQNGQTATISSGMTLSVGDGGTGNPAGIIMNGSTITGGTLNFGTEEGIIYDFKGSSTIRSAITGSGGVVLSGFGNNTMSLGNGGTAVGSTFSGNLTLEGGINYGVQGVNGGAVDNTQFGAPTNSIVINGAEFNGANPGQVVLGATRNVILGADGGAFYMNNDSYNLSMSGSGAASYFGGSGGQNQGYYVTTGNNTYTGGTYLYSGILAFSSQAGVGSSAITFDGNAGISISGTSLTSLTNAMSFVPQTGPFAIDIQNVNNTFTLNGTTQVDDGGTSGFNKYGAGTLVFDGAESYSGTTYLYGGNLVVDASHGGSLGSNTPLQFDGGSLTFLGAGGTGVNATYQSVGNVTMGAFQNGSSTSSGGSHLIVNANGGSETVNLGSLPGIVTTGSGGGVGSYTPTQVGNALQIQAIGSGATILTTSAPDGTDQNGIYGGRIVYTDASGNTNWASSNTTATVNGVSYHVLSGYNDYIDLQSTFSSGGDNASVTDDETAYAPPYPVNSLAFFTTQSGQSFDLNGDGVAIATGGMLLTGSNNYTILDSAGGGFITSGFQSTTAVLNNQYGATYPNSSDLIIQDYATGIYTIQSSTTPGSAGIYSDPTILAAGNPNAGTAAANYATTAGQAASLTKAGPGTLVLTGINTYTGPTFVDGGVLSIASDNSIGGSSGTVTGVTSTAGSTTVTITGSLPNGFGIGTIFLGNNNYVKAISLNSAGTVYTVTLSNGASNTLASASAPFATDTGITIAGGTLEITANVNLQETSTANGITTTATRILGFGSSGGTLDVVNGSTLTVDSGFASAVGGYSSVTIDSNDGSNGRVYMPSNNSSSAITDGITINGGILETAVNMTDGLSTLSFGSGSEINPGTTFNPTAGAVVNTTPTLLMDASQVVAGLDSPLSTTALIKANSVGNKLYLQVDNGGSDSYSGLLNNGAAYNTTLGFTKGGSGIQYLTNNNSTYTGITTIDAGILNVSSISNGGVNPNITTTIGITTATLSSTTGLVVGQVYTVDSANVPMGTTFTYSGSATVTLSSAATASGTNVGADVGVASALGFATNAAGNLIFGGATNGSAVLQYTGTTGAVSTDRLFTIGDNGTTNTGNGISGSITGDTATLDSSSTVTADTVSFTNTGAIAYQNTMYAHNLTLTGSNTGANTFAPVLNDMVGGQATSLSKTGTGTWLLTNANGYSGGTTISGGKLYVNGGVLGTSSGTGSGSVTVTTGGTLAGSGVIKPTGGASVTIGSVAGGAGLSSGGIQVSDTTHDTITGTGLTIDNTEASSTALMVAGGSTLTFNLGAGPSTGKLNFANPNMNSTFLTLTGSTTDLIFSDTTVADTIDLIDLTAFYTGATNTLALRSDNPYLLISTQTGNDSDFANLVTNNGVGVNGYVLGIQNGSGGYTAFNLNATDINGAALATAYNGMNLYLYNGQLEVVPEPGTWALMIGGLALLVVIQRRKNRA